MFSDVLLTVDYDRTLTAPDSTIPERNLEAIRYFMDNGGAFTVNTGRSVPMINPIVDKVPVNAPFLLYNGSAAFDPVTRQLSLVEPIDLDPWQVVRDLQQMFPHLTCEIQGVDAHYAFTPNPAWEAFSAFSHCACRIVPMDSDLGVFLKFTLYGTFHDNTVGGLFDGTPEEIAEIDRAEALVRERWGDKVEVFRPAARIIDALAKGVNKGRAARNLQKQLGRAVLVCAGDALNDLSMMEQADFSYCPADGALKDRFETVCNCASGAVADVIYEKIPEIIRNRA